MGATRILPDDHVLLHHRDVEGMLYADIASRYGVTLQAVGNAFSRMGRPARPPIDYRGIIPWRLKTGDEALLPGQGLYAHIKKRSGYKLSGRAQKRLDDLHVRLRRDAAVLDYREGQPSPWRYVGRMLGDRDMIIRWPADGPPPTDQQRRLLTMD